MCGDFGFSSSFMRCITKTRPHLDACHTFLVIIFVKIRRFGIFWVAGQSTHSTFGNLGFIPCSFRHFGCTFMTASNVSLATVNVADNIWLKTKKSGCKLCTVYATKCPLSVVVKNWSYITNTY